MRTFSETASCLACKTGEDHRVFVTTPPGWGAMVECTPMSRRYGVVVTCAVKNTVLRDRLALTIQFAKERQLTNLDSDPDQDRENESTR